jgi:hypothetical protein
MTERLTLIKKFYIKNQYERVIDTKFSQLATSTAASTAAEIAASTNVINAASTSMNASTNIDNQINEDIQALIDEINILQQQNLELNQQLVELQTSSSQG